MQKIYSCLLILLSLSISTYGQEVRDTLYFDEIILEAIAEENPAPVMIKNAIIINRFSNSRLFRNIENSVGEKAFDSEKRLIIHACISNVVCYFMRISS